MKRMITVIALAMIVGGTTLNAGLQKGAILGQLVEKQSYMSLDSAVVQISGNNLKESTSISADANGLFESANIPYGEYSMKVTSKGFKDVVVKIEIKDKRTDVGIIELEQEAKTKTIILSENIK